MQKIEMGAMVIMEVEATTMALRITLMVIVMDMATWNEDDNFRHVAHPDQIVSLRPLLPTFPSKDPVQPINEP